MAALTNEQIDKIATGVVVRALGNIGIFAVSDYVRDYLTGRISEDEFDDIYEMALAIADDTAQRLLDLDS